MSLTLSQINAIDNGTPGTSPGEVPGANGGSGGAADKTFNNGSFSSTGELDFAPQEFGGSGTAADAGTVGNPGTASGSGPVVYSNGTDGGTGGTGGDDGGASMTLSDISVGASGSAPTTGGVEINATVDGGQAVLASGGGGGGGGSTGINAPGTLGALPGNGGDGGDGGIGGDATASVSAFTSFNSGSNGTDLFTSVTGGVGGNGFAAGAGGEGGTPSNGGTGGNGGDGGSVTDSITGSTFIDGTSIFVHSTASGGAGETGGEGGPSGPGVTDDSAPLQTFVYATNGAGGDGGSGGDATAVISSDTLTAPFVGITLTATGGAKAAGGLGAPLDPLVNNIFEISSGAPAGAPGMSGNEGTGSIDITNNMITVGEGLNGAIPFNKPGTLDLVLNVVEAGVIANGGTQDLDGGAGGNLTFSGNTFLGQGASTLDLQLGGTGSVTIDTNVGTISIAGSPGNAITGFSTFDLDNNNTVIAGSQSLTLNFAADPDTLVYTPTSGDVTINGASPTNLMLEFMGFGAGLTGQTVLNDTTTNGGNTFITIGGSTIELTGFTAGLTGAEITVIPECYRIGTRLATPDGAVAVEDLAVGDLLLTHDGEALPVAWIGSQRIDCARHRSPDSVWPVRIAAHAFAENQPARDLFLSPGHAVYTHGVLIPVRHLLNGDSIAMVAAREVTYFHVELPVHAVLLAEGLPAESYLDTGDRTFFAGMGGNVVPHPAWRRAMRHVAAVWETQAAAELCVSGPTLARVRDHLAGRAESREAGPRRALSRR